MAQDDQQPTWKAIQTLEALHELVDAEQEFAFKYRNGEITATVQATSVHMAWAKLDAVLQGSKRSDVKFEAHPEQTHDDYWEWEQA